jgi:hypothetical protein
MFDVFWVREVFLFGIVAMELLKMMDLVLVFDITMVARAVSGIWELLPRLSLAHPVLPRDAACIRKIQLKQDIPDQSLFLIFCDIRIRRVFEAVGLPDLIRFPDSGVVEIVESKERARIEGVDMVLFCSNI